MSRFASPNSSSCSSLGQWLTLRKLLLIPFVAQAVLITGLVAYWSLNAGKAAIQELVLELSQQTSLEIDQHLEHYLSDARRLCELNAQVLSQGLVDPMDGDAVGRFFWQQVQYYEFGYLLFGQVNGQFVDVGRPETYDAEWITERIDPAQFGDSRLYSFTVDSQGNPLHPLGTPIDYPFQAEAWYTQALRTQSARWTPIYTWQSPSANPLAIAFSHPVYDAAGNLIGAIAVEQRLWQVGEFLSRLSRRHSITAFIVERNGELVASSGINAYRALMPSVTPLELVRRTTDYVENRFGGWHAIATDRYFRIVVRDQSQFVYISPWRDQAGLNWLAVVVIPESKFLAKIQQNMRHALLLSGVTLMVLLVLGIALLQRVIQTITRLNDSAAAIATGNLEHWVPRSPIRELDILSQSFNHMATQLRQSFTQLTQANNALEQKVAQRTAELQTLNDQLQHLSQTDELTQLANRRWFNEYLTNIWQQGQREPMWLSLILTDVDHFKQYNDFYGHPEGDRCLQTIAAILRHHITRSTDLVARYGGEEFAIILPHTDRPGALNVARTLQQAVAQAQIPHARSPINAAITMSFGVASCTAHAIPDPDCLIRHADQALYQAKRQGRNCIRDDAIDLTASPATCESPQPLLE